LRFGRGNCYANLSNSHYVISTPVICIVNADPVPAPPLIVWVAFRACFKSITDAEFAGIDTPERMATSFKESVTVAALPVIFDITMLVTTAVVAAGTVYKVVEVVVVRVVLTRGLIVFGIKGLLQ
jgi:hypothetical protein